VADLAKAYQKKRKCWWLFLIDAALSCQ